MFIKLCNYFLMLFLCVVFVVFSYGVCADSNESSYYFED
jgi:cbb3-type cytochrome oxidase subunit 3